MNIYQGSLHEAEMAGTRMPEETMETNAGDAGTRSRPLLEVRDLRVTFGQGPRTVRAVDGVSYSLSAGSTLAIIGESGSGKSVSSRALMGLLPQTATVTGSVLLEDEDLLSLSDKAMMRHRGASIAMVFQDPMRSLNPTMKIGAQITEAIRAHSRMKRAAAQAQALELLHRMRIPEPRQRFFEYPHQLSGGTRQRVAIAIALAANPRVLIADEATSSLDVTTQAQILELMRDLQQDLGMALIMISHDLSLAASYADHVLVMYAGKAVEYAPTRELFDHVRMPYTGALLEALPRLDRPSHALFPVAPGNPPNLANLPIGCPFQSRCPNVQQDCLKEAPPFKEQAPGHSWACWHPRGDVEGEIK